MAIELLNGTYHREGTLADSPLSLSYIIRDSDKNPSGKEDPISGKST